MTFPCGRSTRWSPPCGQNAPALPDAIDEISIDSRSIRPDELFAIKGDTHDGHAFVKAAARTAPGSRWWRATSATRCRPVRRCWSCPTCSTACAISPPRRGRCTLKDRRRHRLGRQDLDQGGARARAATASACSVASYNNHWGVPLSLARLPETARYGVFEIGMNHAGEIRATDEARAARCGDRRRDRAGAPRILRFGRGDRRRQGRDLSRRRARRRRCAPAATMRSSAASRAPPPGRRRARRRFGERQGRRAARALRAGAGGSTRRSGHPRPSRRLQDRRARQAPGGQLARGARGRAPRRADLALAALALRRAGAGGRARHPHRARRAGRQRAVDRRELQRQSAVDARRLRAARPGADRRAQAARRGAGRRRPSSAPRREPAPEELAGPIRENGIDPSSAPGR